MSFHSFIEKHWVKRSILSYFFLPLAFLFSLVLTCRRNLYKWKLFRKYRSHTFIISVGNLTIGGNGKTPFTILLARALQEEGMNIAVSHRGYKGAYENTIKLISDENKIFEYALQAGDEPLLLAHNLKGIPVVVGKNRKSAVRLLEEKIHPDVIILDDSYQHIKVHHDFDFLLFNAKNPIGNGFLTPAGMLREPLKSIKYADCFVLNDIKGECSVPQIFEKYSTPFLSTSYRIDYFVRYMDLTKNFSSFFAGKKIFLLSGIGNPTSFENSIKELDIKFAHHYQFSDHYEYSKDDIARIIKKTENQKIDAIITTEKDFVKLKELDFNMERFYFAKLEVKINEMDIFNGILGKLKKEIGA
ncbi:MAG: tetraacyldisaccharide 4'-kinase [Candidatus Cloacimonetes bacterium]|nr:tetraacyldisaccharide 4'-kinase [Candidatus Cloacimonadota bacterium]